MSEAPTLQTTQLPVLQAFAAYNAHSVTYAHDQSNARAVDVSVTVAKHLPSTSGDTLANAVQVSGGRSWGRCWEVTRDVVLINLMLRLQVLCHAHVLLQHCSRHLAPAQLPQLLHIDPAAVAAGVRRIQLTPRDVRL
jgi:hypothetical protein